jgi:uncharacterized protein (TIGR04255 family)
LSFHATSYTDFDAFLREILRGFEAISKIAKVSLIQRVGLRYLDLIEGSEANSVQKFVHPLLMGFDPQISGLKAEISQQLFIAKSSLGTLVLRVSVGLHASAIPIELSPLSLNVSRNPDQSNTSIILDTDHFAENLSLTPDSKAIEDLLRQLKLPIAQTFKNSITEFAVKQWDQ